jgi:benzaldehyde dehydrogenase (NAD)
MTLSSLSTLMDQQVWKGKIFTGEWISSTGGEYQSIEPSTGTTLGVVGRASVEDVLRSAERAAEAQRAWASAPFDQRACVLRRAGQLWEEHAADLQQWIIRESGSTAPKAGFELHVAASECYEA